MVAGKIPDLSCGARDLTMMTKIFQPLIHNRVGRYDCDGAIFTVVDGEKQFCAVSFYFGQPPALENVFLIYALQSQLFRSKI
ncbi:hypothetical protein B0T39_23850 [Chromobacterium haemolyticum]|nr:hypothetical protein B0T39_23850 [Chromobacterium haemolyticum]